MTQIRQFLVITMLLLCQGLVAEINKAPVLGALYAEVHGVKSETESICTRLYAGGRDIHPAHGMLMRMWCKNAMPRVHFYNAQNEILSTEYIYDKDVHEKARTYFKQIQSRLTVLSEAARIDVCWVKAPGWQAIELYDKEGHRIAETNCAHRGIKENHTLPAESIKELEGTISNPVLLRTTSIQKIRGWLDGSLILAVKGKLKK